MRYVLVLAIASIAACGSVKLVEKPGTSIRRNARIAVISLASGDPASVRGKLEHHLLASGFTVVSETAARESLAWTERSRNDDLGASRAGAASTELKLPADLILRFIYTEQWDITRYILRSFSATVVDLKTGDVLVSADYSGSRGVDSVVADFVAQLSQKAR